MAATTAGVRQVELERLLGDLLRVMQPIQEGQVTWCSLLGVLSQELDYLVEDGAQSERSNLAGHCAFLPLADPSLRHWASYRKPRMCWCT
eukprot:9163585-Alexandrium_andersonii.AAC.1